MDTNSAHWLDALAGSHDGLAAMVAELDGERLRQRSYCSDWTVAQVLSHLGSGAEISKSYLDAVLAAEPPPDRAAFPAIWDRWNAMTPEQQADGFVAYDGQLIESLENLGDRLDELEFTMFGGMRMDAVGFLGMRLSEHAVHAWDVYVTFDPTAKVETEGVQLLVDRLPMLSGWTGKPEGAGTDRPFAVVVHTSEPQRWFDITVDDAVEVKERTEGSGGAASSGGTPVLQLPAEAFLRLVYGRLDPAHAPPASPEDAALMGRLRLVFPGL